MMYKSILVLVLAILATLVGIGCIVMRVLIGRNTNSRASSKKLATGLTVFFVMVAAWLWLGYFGIWSAGANRFGSWLWPAVALTVITVLTLIWLIRAYYYRERFWVKVRRWIYLGVAATLTVFAWLGFAHVWDPTRQGTMHWVLVAATAALIGFLIYAIIQAFRGYGRWYNWVIAGIAAVVILILWLFRYNILGAAGSTTPTLATASPRWSRSPLRKTMR